MRSAAARLAEPVAPASPSGSEASRVAAEICALAERVAAGGGTGAEIDALSERARVAADAATDGERVGLVDALAALEQSVVGALDRLGAELRKAGERRRALAGFRSVRAWTTAQNLRTRV